MIGTPFYLSPEICNGENYTFKTDIWSFGCILYELCTKRRPFDAPNIYCLVMKILQEPYTPIPTYFSSEMKQLVDLLLQKNARRRPGIEQILKLPYVRIRVSRSHQIILHSILVEIFLKKVNICKQRPKSNKLFIK